MKWPDGPGWFEVVDDRFNSLPSPIDDFSEGLIAIGTLVRMTFIEDFLEK